MGAGFKKRSSSKKETEKAQVTYFRCNEIFTLHSLNTDLRNTNLNEAGHLRMIQWVMKKASLGRKRLFKGHLDKVNMVGQMRRTGHVNLLVLNYFVRSEAVRGFNIFSFREEIAIASSRTLAGQSRSQARKLSLVAVG